ncbi:ABC transporter ATP-binding protein [Ottowia thiooxydans]|uniref:ABC transporter ATP-binding protein n=1 Tax=Ottowia thiooxydans TaxID=219182 RepID=UPI000420E87E|nr:ABC transporter ATP-binding protein [Ottowia thiooxydans]
MNNVALKCQGVTVSYGALKAVNDVNHEFREGRIYGLIGPNGAGKTTLLNVLAGRQMRHSGQVYCGDQDISKRPAYERARMGIGRSFQIIKIFGDMTVNENLLIAAQSRRPGFQPFWISRHFDKQFREQLDSILELTGLTAYRNDIAGTLPYGLQRSLELGVTLLPDPKILLLDEPLAGIGHHEIESALQLIKNVSQGRTVLLIEHNMEAVMSLSSEIVVMSNGSVIACGAPEVIKKNEAVRSIYLGEDAE